MDLLWAVNKVNDTPEPEGDLKASLSNVVVEEISIAPNLETCIPVDRLPDIVHSLSRYSRGFPGSFMIRIKAVC